MSGIRDAVERVTRKNHGTATLITLAWAAVILPSLTQSLTAPKHRMATSDVAPYSTTAELMNVAITLTLALLCVLLVFRHLHLLPVDRRGVLLVMVVPWVYQMSRDLYADSPPRLGGLLYPLLLFGTWILQPTLRQLSTLGYLVGLTALISVLMAALLPAKGILESVAGDVITPEKQILPWGILIGPLTDGNPLGQFLALGLPSVLLIPNRAVRAGLAALTVFAVVWTSSRSSLAAIAVGALVVLLLRLTPRGGRRAVVVLVLSGLAALVVYLPLATRHNDAYTNRGYIWQASLRHWSDQPWLGLGSQWYAESAKYANNIGWTAFHGHNEFVQLLVIGGLVNVVLVAFLLMAVIRAAAAWAEQHGVLMPAAFMAMLFVSALLEVSFSFSHRSFLLPVTLLPMTFFVFARPEPPREPELPEAAEPAPSATTVDPTPLPQSALAAAALDSPTTVLRTLEWDPPHQLGQSRRQSPREDHPADGSLDDTQRIQRSFEDDPTHVLAIADDEDTVHHRR
jgi:O-antigen ligase